MAQGEFDLARALWTGAALVVLVTFAVFAAFAFRQVFFSLLAPPLPIFFVVSKYADLVSASHLSRSRASVKLKEFLQLLSRELPGHYGSSSIPQSTTKIIHFLS